MKQAWEWSFTKKPDKPEKCVKKAQNKLKLKKWRQFWDTNTWIQVKTWKFSCLMMNLKKLSQQTIQNSHLPLGVLAMTHSSNSSWGALLKSPWILSWCLRLAIPPMDMTANRPAIAAWWWVLSLKKPNICENERWLRMMVRQSIKHSFEKDPATMESSYKFDIIKILSAE